jgi:hypothetical protein
MKTEENELKTSQLSQAVHDYETFFFLLTFFFLS